MRLEMAYSPYFQERAVPEETRLAGWTALVKELTIPAPVRQPSCVSEKHIKGSQREQRGWRIFDKRYWPGESFADHLNFAFRHETLDLLILKRVFDAVPGEAVAAAVRAAPTGVPARRIWYFYEWLTGKTLDLPDARSVAAIDLLDPAAYFTARPRPSKRHRVRDNLPGTARFCPLIRRTKALEEYIGRELDQTARETVGRTGAHLVARAASFMLLADSRASFEIEGERPPRNRLERWGRAIMQAGRNKLTAGEIARLHQILIEDTRFIKPGLRSEGVFLGERDHNHDPLPEFVGARPEDLPDLMRGLIDANDRMGEGGIDPVLQATATAFGCLVHPFQDGNGRCIVVCPSRSRRT